MSAIWGVIDLQGKKLQAGISQVFAESYKNCVIDRYEEVTVETVYLGCGIQYFTKESVGEKMPLAEEGAFFTADVVLDNREELYAKLLGSKKSLAEMPDGELLYYMYRDYGRDCLNDLLGAFAFVYYDQKEKRAEIVIDAVGDRCVYYAVQNEMLYFSSLMEPLIRLTGTGLNDRWITDFLAMDHLFMSNEAEETPYEGIYRVAPAQRVIIKAGKIEKEKYWNPFENFQELKLANDEEYAKAFRLIFCEAVKGVMRDRGDMSILLSGGLDSNAVAAVASGYLKEKGKMLYSYTSVPLRDYVPQKNGWDLEDESEAVQKTTEYLGNVEPTFVNLEGINPWKDRQGELRIMEMPYKSVQNMLWIPECMRRAYDRGSRMMLTGSFGNTTISYTDLEVYMNDLYQRKKWITLYRELKIFSKADGFSMRYAKKQIKNAGKNSSKIKTDWNSLYGKSFVRPAMVEKEGAAERMLAMKRKFAEASLCHDATRKLMVQDVALRQIGEAGTKHSLATGVLLRDPTKDKRVISFCLSLPVEQFCKEGKERRLVREYLKDRIPPHILQAKTKGKQSADLAYRMSLKWEEIRQEWIQLYQSYPDSRYVDSTKACTELLQNPDMEKYTTQMLVRHMYTLMVLELENQMEA